MSAKGTVEEVARAAESHVLAVRVGQEVARSIREDAPASCGAIAVYPTAVVAVEKTAYRGWDIGVSLEPGSVLPPGNHPVTFESELIGGVKDTSGVRADGVRVRGTFYVGVGCAPSPRQVTFYDSSDQEVPAPHWSTQLPDSIQLPVLDAGDLHAERERLLRRKEDGQQAYLEMHAPMIDKLVSARARGLSDVYGVEDLTSDLRIGLLEGLTLFATAKRPATTHIHWTLVNLGRRRDELIARHVEMLPKETSEILALSKFLQCRDPEELRRRHAQRVEVFRRVRGGLSQREAEQAVMADMAVGRTIPESEFSLNHFKVALAHQPSVSLEAQAAQHEDDALSAAPGVEEGGYADVEAQALLATWSRELTAAECRVFAVATQGGSRQAPGVRSKQEWSHIAAVCGLGARRGLAVDVFLVAQEKMQCAVLGEAPSTGLVCRSAELDRQVHSARRDVEQEQLTLLDAA